MRKFAHSILQCLELLNRNRLIHCDLKPENVLLKQQGRSGIKVYLPFFEMCQLHTVIELCYEVLKLSSNRFSLNVVRKHI